MNIVTRFFLTSALLTACLPDAQAHCLVLRYNLVSKKESSDSSAAVDNPNRPPPSTTSFLAVIDLEKEFTQWSWNANSSLNTQTEDIWIDDGSPKTFSHGIGKDPNSKASSGWTKFGFFKSGSYFYVFNVDIEDFGYWGFDYGSFPRADPAPLARSTSEGAAAR